MQLLLYTQGLVWIDRRTDNEHEGTTTANEIESRILFILPVSNSLTLPFDWSTNSRKVCNSATLMNGLNQSKIDDFHYILDIYLLTFICFKNVSDPHFIDSFPLLVSKPKFNSHIRQTEI